MPFGLRNAAQMFQRLICGLPFVYAYLDDLLVASSTEEKHEARLRLLFERPAKYGIVIDPSECKFWVPSLTFLSQVVDKHGICPLEEHVITIQAFPAPTSLCKLREFLGLVNFYRRFIPNCTDVSQPLTDIML